VLEIAQGWLPGERLKERIRRVVGADGERYWRGLKRGAGPQRLEAEEEITRDMFEALWPLTEGRRISKHRRKIEDGRRTWEIDEFEGRDLVLAEVELPAEDVTATVPDWLRPLVVREVTDDLAYFNENLARAQAVPAAPVRAEPGHEVSQEQSGAPETADGARPPSDVS
jgi:CYTH domain-containing protein